MRDANEASTGYAVTLNRCRAWSIDGRSNSPRSFNAMPEPATRSLTVRDAGMCACLTTSDDIAIAVPAGPPAAILISPVWTPMQWSRPRSHSRRDTERAHSRAHAGPSKIATIPSGREEIWVARKRRKTSPTASVDGLDVILARPVIADELARGFYAPAQGGVGNDATLPDLLEQLVFRNHVVTVAISTISSPSTCGSTASASPSRAISNRMVSIRWPPKL